MTAKDRNDLAKQSRKNPAILHAAIAANRAANRAISDRQNRHTLATNLPTVTGPGPRKSKRSGRDKGQNEWRTTSPYYRTMATVDSRWSA